jgi:hypothetical protein
MGVIELIIMLIGLIMQLMADSGTDSGDAAGEVAIGNGSTEGWFSTVWNGFKKVVSTVGTGLVESDFSTADLRQFSLEKQAGVYASIGIGDDGIIQAGSDGLSKVIRSPWAWVALGYLLLRRG